MIATTITSIQDIMRQDTGVDGDAQLLSPDGGPSDRNVAYCLKKAGRIFVGRTSGRRSVGHQVPPGSGSNRSR